MTEWFEEWFNDAYLHLYPHRDDADAERLVALLVRVLPWRPGWRVLDVACGEGRHARALAAAGARVVGLDLSPGLLARAREATRAPLVRADLRDLPVRRGTMDLTVNLFTSFGYFDSDGEHAAALAGMVQTVRPGGWFALDFLNAAAVRATLVPEEAGTLAGTSVTLRRRLEDAGRYVVKDIELADGRRFRERVRLFEPAELEAMLAGVGAEVHHRFGDYDGAPLAAGSPRVLLLAGRR
jgi:SAM-dependent methyltransferase